MSETDRAERAPDTDLAARLAAHRAYIARRAAEWRQAHPPREYFGAEAQERLRLDLALERGQIRRAVRRLQIWVAQRPARCAAPARAPRPRTSRHRRAHRVARPATRGGDSGDDGPAPPGRLPLARGGGR